MLLSAYKSINFYLITKRSLFRLPWSPDQSLNSTHLQYYWFKFLFCSLASHLDTEFFIFNVVRFP